MRSITDARLSPEHKKKATLIRYHADAFIILAEIFNCRTKLQEKNNGKEKLWRPEKFRSQRNDKNSLFRLWKRMRSPLQTNGGQAGLLQRLPPETPETPVLILLFYPFFIDYT